MNRPLWLFLAEPGLGPLLGSELKFAGKVQKKAQFARLKLRNHDLLVLPGAVVSGRGGSSRLATNILEAPVFGRDRITDFQFDLLAKACRRMRADSIVRVVAGSRFSGAGVVPGIERELVRRAIRLDHAGRHPVWFVAVDEKYWLAFERSNYHDAPGRSRAREREGSLPVTVAAAMVFVAKLGKNEVVFDPCMGTGTILAEAGSMAPDASLVGCDRDAKAVVAARDTLSGGKQFKFIHGDATRVDAPTGLTLTISNLPFGRKFATAGGAKSLYENILRRSLAEAADSWRAILLTSEGDALAAAVEAIGGLALSLVADIRLRGLDAGMFRIARAR